MIRKLYIIHAWTGYSLGFFLLILTLTGLPALFKQEIDEALNSSIFYIKPEKQGAKPLQELMDVGTSYIHQQYPEYKINRFVVPQSKESPFMVEFRRGDYTQFDIASVSKIEYRQLFINPYTARIIEDRNYYQTTAFFIRNLHVRFFDNYYGRFLLGIMGLIFMLNIFCGLLIYPKFLYKGKIFKIRKHNAKLMWSDWHKLGGFFTFFFLLMMTVTGTWLGVQSQFMKWFSIEKPNQFSIEKSMVKQEDEAQKVDYEKALQTLSKTFPELESYYLTVSTQGENTITFSGTIPNLPYERYTQKAVFYKADFQQPLWIYDVRDHSWKDQLFYLQEGLHFGDFYGISLKILYAILSFIMIGIIVTGYYLRYKKSKQKKRMKRYFVRGGISFVLLCILLFIGNIFYGAPLTSWFFVIMLYTFLIGLGVKKIVQFFLRSSIFSA